MEMKLWLRDFKVRCAEAELVNSDLRIGNYSEKNKLCNHKKKNWLKRKHMGDFRLCKTCLNQSGNEIFTHGQTGDTGIRGRLTVKQNGRTKT